MNETRTDWIRVAALLVAGLFAAAQFGKLTLSLPVLREVYAEGGAFVPVLVSIVGVVGIILGAVAGSVVARIGLRRALIGGLLAGGALSLVQASLPGIWTFAGLRVLEGLSHLAIVVAAPTLMAQAASDRDRALVMGIWAAFFGIAMAIIAVLLPLLLPLGGLGAVFAAHGAGMAFMGLVMWRVLQPEAPVQPRQVSFLNEHRIIYTTPRLLIAGAGFVWYTILYIALLAVLPLALELPVWAITGLPLISIVGALAGGALGRRFAPDVVVTAGFALTIASAGLTYLFSAALWPLFALFFVMALIPAGSFAAIPYFNDSVVDRARATGGIAQLGNVGTTLGTPIFVLVLEGAGFAAVCGLVVGFCLLGMGATRLLLARVR